MKTTPPQIDFFDQLTPLFDERSLYRYLGYPAGKSPDPRVRDALRREKKLLPDLLKPRGVFGLFPGAECFDAGFPLYGRQVYLCVVTIGNNVEKRAAEYAGRGDVLSGFVLDTLGSVYAEGVAEEACCRLAAIAQKAGLTVGCRISPGYGAWQLAYQRKIFELLPAEKIGVRLTPGLMMVPRKSVSFAVERAADPIRMREGEQCDYCELEQCRYRRARKKTKKNGSTLL
jgi:hypothetical protein